MSACMCFEIKQLFCCFCCFSTNAAVPLKWTTGLKLSSESVWLWPPVGLRHKVNGERFKNVQTVILLILNIIDLSFIDFLWKHHDDLIILCYPSNLRQIVNRIKISELCVHIYIEEFSNDGVHCINNLTILYMISYTFTISRYIDKKSILINIVILISIMSPSPPSEWHYISKPSAYTRLRSLNKTSTPLLLCSCKTTSHNTCWTSYTPLKNPCTHLHMTQEHHCAPSSPLPLQRPLALCM